MTKYRNQNYLKLNADDFIIPKSPYHVYVLGFIWADGTVLSNRKSIRIEIVEDDMNELAPILEHTGKWYMQRRERPNRRPQATASGDNKKLVDFLEENDYLIKSQASPTKILSTIPDDWKHYFYRGWVDGDGCFYNGKTARQFTMSGANQLDWTDLESYLTSHGISHKVSRRNTKTGGYSYVRISNKFGISKFGQLIYAGEQFGLSRKKSALDVIAGTVS